MSITRKPVGEQPFTTFANTLLNDEALAADALGVLVCLCSKPGNWKVMPGVLAKRFHCGRDKIYRIMNDLIAAGYATRSPDRDGAGKITGWNYEVSNEKMPVTENPEVDGKPLPENTTSGESAPQKKDNSTKEKKDSYSEAFEEVWKLAQSLGAPRTANTSKKKAYDHWRMLNDQNQARVRAAIPMFAAAMKAEGRPPDKIKHLQFYLSERIYETVNDPTTAQKQQVAEWHKTATRKQWAQVLQIWAGTNDWRASWGPEPGKPGCSVPLDMIAAHNIKYRGFMFSEEQLEAFRFQALQAAE